MRAAGESYAGVYVPLLAQRLLKARQRGGSTASSGGGRYNLAGYIVGNAVTDDAYDTAGQVEYAYGTGLIDPTTHDAVLHTCQVRPAQQQPPPRKHLRALRECVCVCCVWVLDPHCVCHVNPALRTQSNRWDVSDGSACANALSRMEGAVMGPINPYDTLLPCFHHDDEAGPPDGGSGEGGGSASLRQLLRAGAASWPLRPSFPQGANATITNAYALAKAAAARGGPLRHTISCADRRAALAYYNDAGARAAIHAAPVEEAGRWLIARGRGRRWCRRSTAHAGCAMHALRKSMRQLTLSACVCCVSRAAPPAPCARRWEPCSDVLSYRHTAGSMIPVHQELLDAGLRGLVLSGDADYVVPFTGSRAWVYSLRRRVVKPWRPWQLARGDGQVRVRRRSRRACSRVVCMTRMRATPSPELQLLHSLRPASLPGCRLPRLVWGPHVCHRARCRPHGASDKAAGGAGAAAAVAG